MRFLKLMVPAFVLLAALSTGNAPRAQVKQSGNVTPGHAVKWTSTGVVSDAGTASSGSLSSLGVTASGPGICQNSGPTTGAFNRICLNATSTAGGISLENIGGASGGFTFTLNGVAQGLATVTLPVSVNDFACFADTSGTLKDCGGSLIGPAGSNTQVQFNASGVFGASANLTWISPALTIGANASATGQLKLAGLTSGTATITAQATAGTPTLTLPNASGTFAVSASLPLALSATTGALTCTGCVTGPGTSVVGNIAIWNDTTGTTLADGGSAGAGGFNVEFINAGTTTGMNLIAYNGKTLQVYCTTTTSWKTFDIPSSVAITNATSNGGLIRITHAATARPLQTNQFVWITQVGGVTAANEIWKITVINSTTFDLQGSTFSGVYTSGGLVYGSVAGRSDNITINGVAAQAFAADTPYYLGIQFFDSGCTVGQLVATSTSYSVDTTVGINVLTGYANTPLVGACVKHNGTIQGSANSELCLSWYNRGRVDLVAGPSGNTGGVLNTWTKLTNTLDFLIWADAMPVVALWCGVSGTAALNKIDMGMSYLNSATAPDYFQTVYDIAGGVGLTANATLPFPAVTPGFYRVTAWLRTVVGTATVGNVTNCTMVANTEF